MLIFQVIIKLAWNQVQIRDSDQINTYLKMILNVQILKEKNKQKNNKKKTIFKMIMRTKKQYFDKINKLIKIRKKQILR